MHPLERIRERLAAVRLRFDRLGLGEEGGSRSFRLPAEAIAGHAGRAAEAAADLQRGLASGEEVFVASRPTGGAEKLKRLALEYGFHVSSERGTGRRRLDPGRDLGRLPAEGAAPGRLLGGGDLRRRAPFSGRAPQAVGGLPLRPARPEARRRRRPRGLRHRPIQGPEARAGRRGRARVHGDRVRRRQGAAPAGRAAGPRAEVFGRRGRRARARPARRRRLGPAEGLGAQRHARHDRPAPEALRPAQSRRRLRVLQGFALAEGVRGRLRVRRDARPGAGDRRRQARHAVGQADGPPSVRRRRLRKDRGRDARRVQGGARRQAGGGPRADDDPRGPALPDLPPALRGLSGDDRVAVALPLPQRAEGGRRESRRRLGRHSDRHAPDARPGSRVSRPGAPHRGRGAALRGRAEGAAQGVEGLDRRPLDVGDADPAVAPPFALGPARPLDHRDAAAGPPRDRDAGRADASGDHPRGDRGGDRPGRPGVLRAQPHRVDRPGPADAGGAAPVGADRGGPRADAGGRAREGDAPILLAGGRPAPRDRRSSRTGSTFRRRTRSSSTARRPSGSRSSTSCAGASAAATSRPMRTSSCARPARSRTWPGSASPRSSEFCDLGAGFRIAARDLEIRGSGNMLGGEQSGHIASVGFETYLHAARGGDPRDPGRGAAARTRPSRCPSGSISRSRMRTSRTRTGG